MGDKKREKEIIKSLEEIKNLVNKKLVGDSYKLKITKWIDDNKNLLIATGSVIAATAKIISWLIENTENVKLLLDSISINFKSPESGMTLDVDSIFLFKKPLTEIFEKDNYVLRDFIKTIAINKGFNKVYSMYYNYDCDINEI